MSGSVLLALTLEHDKLLVACFEIGLQLRHLHLQLLLGGLGSCGWLYSWRSTLVGFNVSVRWRAKS